MFGAALGLAGAIGGSFLQRRADKKAYRAQMANIERTLGLLDAGETRASEFLRNALGAVEAAGQQAMAQTAQAEFQGYRALGDGLKQGQGRFAQYMANRGMAGTSVMGAGNRGIYADYARGVGQLAGQMGQVRSQIALNTGSGRAQAFSGMANNASQMAQSRAGLLGNVQYQGPQGLAQNYALLGSALGGALDGWSSWAAKRSPKLASMRSKASTLGGMPAL